MERGCAGANDAKEQRGLWSRLTTIAESRIGSVPVTFDEKTCSFHCTGCMQDMPVRRRTFESPEAYVEFLEMVVLDHTECDEYQDIKRAEAARRFRKEVKRLMLVTARVK